MVPILSNSEHKTVDFFDVVLKNDKISSSTAKNNLNMLNEKFMNISETANFMLVFPEALENFTDASTDSKIFIPLLSMVKPIASAFISIVFPFETSLHKQEVEILFTTSIYVENDDATAAAADALRKDIAETGYTVTPFKLFKQKD